MKTEARTRMAACLLAAVVMVLGGSSVCAAGPANHKATQTSEGAKRTTPRPRSLPSLEAVELRPSKPRGAAAVRPLSDPGKLTGAGLSLTNLKASSVARITEMATRNRTFGDIDVQAMEELLTTKHLFRKIAAIPPRAVHSGIHGGMASTLHQTVSLERLSNFSLSGAAGNPGNIVPSSVHVQNIGPESTLRVIRSLTIQLRKHSAAIQVRLP